MAISRYKFQLTSKYINGMFIRCPQVFGRMFKEITVAQAFLTTDNAEHEINRVLRECLLKKRPVYIAIPSDIANKEIDVKWEALNTEPEKNSKEVEEDAVRLKTLIAMSDFQLPSNACVNEGRAHHDHSQRGQAPSHHRGRLRAPVPCGERSLKFH